MSNLTCWSALGETEGTCNVTSELGFRARGHGLRQNSLHRQVMVDRLSFTGEDPVVKDGMITTESAPPRPDTGSAIPKSVATPAPAAPKK